MTDDQFWKIADEVEEIDAQGQPYVPAKNAMLLADLITSANNFDLDESLADLTLFDFKRNTILNRVAELLKQICQTKNKQIKK